MRDIGYGCIHIKLKDIMATQNISVNSLAGRANMQRSQLRSYIKEKNVRVDLCVLARLCYALDCDITDLLEYAEPEAPETAE